MLTSVASSNISFVIWARILLSGRLLYRNLRKSMAFKTCVCWWSWFCSQNLFSVLMRGVFRNKSCKLTWISEIPIPELPWTIAIREAQRKTIQASNDDLAPHLSKMPRFISAKLSTLSVAVSCWSMRRCSHMVAWMITSQRCGTSTRLIFPAVSQFGAGKVLTWCFTCVPRTRLSVA